MRKNTFDNVAWIYDRLANLVFRGNIKKAQLHFLSSIQSGSNVLIIGGGTGWLLNELDNCNKSMSIDYLEASGKMIDLSESKRPFQNIEVNFMHGTHDNIIAHKSYDVIITNFFLDVFNEDNLQLVMDKLDHHLKDKGLWIMTDFVNAGKFWQMLLVKIMYAFFRFSANLEGSKLLDFSVYFDQLSYKLKREKRNFHGMIASRIYAK